jgi:hypothetical protein
MTATEYVAGEVLRCRMRRAELRQEKRADEGTRTLDLLHGKQTL